MKLIKQLNEDDYKYFIKYFEKWSMNMKLLNVLDDYLADLGFFLDVNRIAPEWKYDYQDDSQDYILISYWDNQWHVDCKFDWDLNSYNCNSVQEVISFLSV